jgi:streptogramin lyase
MFRKLKIVLSIIFCAYLSVSAQDNYKFLHLNVRKGLAHNNVYSLFQDKTGFVWVGTQNGLSKFNGYTFHNYSHDAEDSTTLISDNFGVIFEDSKGRIWLGTYNGGITLYDRANARVYSFVNDEKNPKSMVMKRH